MNEAIWSPPILVGTADGKLVPLDDHHRYMLPIDETYSLLDLQTCISDLETVIALGGLIEVEAREGDFNFSLWDALVITYGRCFQSGKSYQPGQSRAGLGQFLEALAPEQMDHHRSLMKARNSQVAHKVANGGASVTVSFRADGSFAGIDSIQIGKSASFGDLQGAVSVAMRLRDLAWVERDRMVGEPEERWRTTRLTSPDLASAERAREDYVAEQQSSSA